MDFEELLFQAKGGNQNAVKELLEMYRPLLIKYALVNGMLDEDLYQELIIEMIKCIRFFRKLE